ncbi:Panacea domain-containing protein [Chloroflexota bacterium]
MLACLDVADYFLSIVNDGGHDYMTSLKLQRLVYYAQGLHLARYNEPLFTEEIQAWTYGPVISELYFKYRDLGDTPIATPPDIDSNKYDNEMRAFLDEVYQIFRQYSTRKPNEMMRDEPPVEETIRQYGVNTTISHKLLKDYFSQFIKKEDG